MRRTAVVATTLLLAGSVAPAHALAASTTSGRHQAPAIRQHAINKGRRAFVTHSSASKEFDQNVVNSGYLIPVTSSTDTPLELGVFIDQYSLGKTAETDLEINVASGDETHAWDIEAPRRSMIYDPLSGQGQINVSAKSIAPYGSVQLEIKPAGAPVRTTCASGGRRVVRPVTLSGTVQFDTQTTTWGTVGDTVDQLKFTQHANAESDYGHVGSACDGFRPVRCQGDVELDLGGSAGFLSLNTYERKGQRDVATFIDHPGGQLAGNLNGFADDLAFPDLPVPKIHHAKKHPAATLDAGTTGVLTGSGTFTSYGTSRIRHGLCRGGTSRSWSAGYTNGSTPLTLNFAMNGSFAFKNEPKHEADIEIDSGA